MKIKSVIIFTWELMVSPILKWKSLAEENEGHEKFLEKFFYPLLGIMSFALFISGVIKPDEFSFHQTLKQILVQCVVYLGGLYGATYSIDYIKKHWFEIESDYSRTLIFVGACYAPRILLGTLFDFLPNLGLGILLWVVVPYSVWNANLYYFANEKTQKTLIFILLSAIMIIIPEVLKRILWLLMPGLKY